MRLGLLTSLIFVYLALREVHAGPLAVGYIVLQHHAFATGG